ncbi:hypothetical protein EA462_02610 [Natrarchaeobius halalkaliphilus]|uniref:Uncharacterized protein n=1 Tax=Natrarchaeobius halalkaliphilus TaxID=1679091 RepID=A0A3N6P9Y2_9EURY|nr:hypothetical protein [Natrarchaeobius halalkaliphilus]RQG93115.1 hypothetical protein EA462_02610 [Natrarchaeobius halalkaliphilus]
MTNRTEPRPSTVSVSLDDRARIPFAIIGVLLLVTSVTFVALLDSRVPPEPTVDTSLAMDRTAATTQTIVQGAVADATESATQEPLMVPDGRHPWGAAIADVDDRRDSGWIDELPNEYDDESYDVDPDRAFERYVKLRIYAAVETDLDQLDGEFRGRTTTNVTVAPLEETTASATDAIDRVELRPGIDPENDLEPGQLEVTIQNVRMSIERDGREVVHRIDDVTVTVGTNVFVLHQATREYEQQLNMDVVEGGLDDPTSLEGFGQHYAARIYPLGWARGTAQWGGAPVSEVIANRHSEVLANDAVFTLQESVFGASDPHSDTVMRNAWGCLAAQDAEELYEGQTGDEPPVADAEAFCSGLEYLYGDQNANLDEPVDTMDVMEAAGTAAGAEAGMGAERTISVDEFANLAYAQTLAELDIHDAIDDVHSVDTEASLERVVDRTRYPRSGRPSGLTDSSNWTRTANDLDTTTTVDVSVDDGDPDTADRETTYHTATVTVSKEHERDLRWSYRGPENVSSPVTRTRRSASEYETEIQVTAWHPDRDAIDYRGIDGGYDDSTADEWPHSLPDGFFDADGDGWGDQLAENVTLENYAAFPDESARHLLGIDPGGDIEAQLEDQITAPGEIESEGDLRDQLVVADGDRTTLEASAPNELIATAIALDLYYVRTQLQADADEITFDDGELLTGDPFGELNDEVDDQLVYHRVPDRYPTAADKARIEARQTYVENVKAQIETTSDATQFVQNELRERIDLELDLTETADDVLEGLTDFSREVAGGGVDYQHAEIDSPYSDELELTPVGSPTYLSLEAVDAEQVPATADGNHTPMVARNNNWFAIPYNEVDAGLFGEILNWVTDADDEVLTLRMAGELLEAARLADLLLEEEDEKIVDDDQVYEDLEDAVRQSIDGIDDKTVENLNDLEYDLELDDDRVATLVNEGIDGIGDGTPGQQAAMLGSGDGVEYVERHVREEIDPDNHGEHSYASDEVFKQHAGASVNYALTEAVNQTVVDGFDPNYVNYLNESVRGELEDRAEEVVSHRLNETIDETDLEHDWLRNNESGILNEDGEFNLSPNRIPAGLPIVPLPGGWVATTNVWDVEVKGEYARFELASNAGDPSTIQGENYVRENGDVFLEGNHLGSTRPISFESRTIVIVVVPPKGLGVGDRTGDWAEESEGWPEAGPDI